MNISYLFCDSIFQVRSPIDVQFSNFDNGRMAPSCIALFLKKVRTHQRYFLSRAEVLLFSFRVCDTLPLPFGVPTTESIPTYNVCTCKRQLTSSVPRQYPQGSTEAVQHTHRTCGLACICIAAGDNRSVARKLGTGMADTCTYYLLYPCCRVHDGCWGPLVSSMQMLHSFCGK